MHDKESKLPADLSFWLGMEEDMLRQKSKKSWMHLGDKSPKIFHSVVNVKTARNHISSLICQTGTPISNMEVLKDMAPGLN